MTVSPRPVLAGEPYPDAALVSQDVVEAALWRLLAGRRTVHDRVDVPWLMELIGQYARTFAVRCGRDAQAFRGFSARSAGVTLDSLFTAPALIADLENLPASNLGNGEDPGTTDGPGHKTCPRCGQTLTLDSFYRDTRRPHGRQSYCKDCHGDLRRARDRLRAGGAGRVRAELAAIGVSVPPDRRSVGAA